jgi:N-acetylmuramoyl-L-alanine amidase
MQFLIYIIKTVFISGLLLGYYWLFLRHRVFHGFNRLYLLAIPVISFLLPAFHFPIPELGNAASAASPIHLLGVSRGNLEEAFTVYANRNSAFSLSWPAMAGLFSAGVSLMLICRFIFSMRYLSRLKKQNYPIHLHGAAIYIVTAKGTPFSFFKSIFWAKDMPLDNPVTEKILRHELYHVKENHTRDLIFMELFSIACWFNPFFHMISSELKALHEFTADAYAMQDSDEIEYARLLLLNLSGSALSMTHPFFKNQIKRRIAMIIKIKKSNPGLLGRLMILPLVAGLSCLFSFRMENPRTLLSRLKPMRVVIDAGHGGSFTGAEANGQLEKNINLAIAKKIQSLSHEYNVEVIMTRESDVSPGSTELRTSLEYITALPKNKNADLLISIHTNATETAEQGKQQTEKSGFQIYIPRNSSAVYDNSVKLGSAMTEVIKSDYTIEPELKQPENGSVYILKNATVPALVIECGYIDNPNDMKYLQDGMNQEKIARDILEGIRKYSHQNTAYSGDTSVKNEFPGSDTISEAQMNQIDGDKILSLDFNTNANLITIHLKNGKKYFTVITPDMKRRADSLANHTPDYQMPVFTKVEELAKYPGGQTAWYQYLIKNLKYPDYAAKHEIQGTVVVEFIVQKDGTLKDVRAIEGPDSLRSESVRVLLESGKWIPAKNNKRLVDSYQKQPFIFKLAVAK